MEAGKVMVPNEDEMKALRHELTASRRKLQGLTQYCEELVRCTRNEFYVYEMTYAKCVTINSLSLHRLFFFRSFALALNLFARTVVCAER